jgi:hypothetical protein
VVPEQGREKGRREYDNGVKKTGRNVYRMDGEGEGRKAETHMDGEDAAAADRAKPHPQKKA